MEAIILDLGLSRIGNDKQQNVKQQDHVKTQMLHRLALLRVTQAWVCFCVRYMDKEKVRSLNKS